MAKIRSNTELQYNARGGKTGIIQLEINGWTYEPNNNRYVAIVKDYLIETIQENEQSIETKKLINSKEVLYPSSQIDGLFYLLQNPIELTESYTSEMDNLISQALLYVTQQDPVYGSNSSDWQIV